MATSSTYAESEQSYDMENDRMDQPMLKEQAENTAEMQVETVKGGINEGNREVWNEVRSKKAGKYEHRATGNRSHDDRSRHPPFYGRRKRHNPKPAVTATQESNGNRKSEDDEKDPDNTSKSQQQNGNSASNSLSGNESSESDAEKKNDESVEYVAAPLPKTNPWESNKSNSTKNPKASKKSMHNSTVAKPVELKPPADKDQAWSNKAVAFKSPLHSNNSEISNWAEEVEESFKDEKLHSKLLVEPEINGESALYL